MKNLFVKKQEKPQTMGIAKRSLLSAACLFTLTCACFAQDSIIFIQQSKPLASGEKWRRWYAEMGLCVAVFSPEPQSWSSSEYPVKTMAPVGASIDFGFYINPHHRLSADIGFGSHLRRIGTFSYTKTYTNGTQEDFDDGKLNREYSLFSFLISYHYVFTPSEKFHIRLGASIGGSSLSATCQFTPEIDNKSELLDKYGIKDADEGMAVFSPGIGLIWNFGKRWYLDAGYRPMLGGGFEVDDFKLASPAWVHQFTLNIGVRF